MIIVVGIGPGKRALILDEGIKAIEQADKVIGSVRQLASFPEVAKEKRHILPKKLTDLKVFLEEHQQQKCVVLASGDPLLYGIGNWLSKQFEPAELQIITGISSMQYLFSKVRLSQNDCYFTSSHGKTPNLDLLLSLPKVAMVTDETVGPFELAQAAVASGKTKRLLIGENLSYPTERIEWFLAEEVPKRQYEMNVVVIVDA